MTTHSLAEVAAAHLPAEWKDGRRWLASRLNRGELRGVRFGRTWRMRDADVAYMLARYSNDDSQVEDKPKRVATEPASVVDGLSERSRRRLRNAS
jgi:hypothetical protein